MSAAAAPPPGAGGPFPAGVSGDDGAGSAAAPPAPRVVLYVSGSIAAYKACEVVTGLRRRGCEVRVAMTAAAGRFVSAMTFQALSGHPVAVSPWGGDAATAGENPAATAAEHGMAHLSLAGWAQVQAAVPASADLIARLAHGLADDAVTATALACRAPLVLAPAMETAMWESPATRANVAVLRRRGAVLVGPEAGRLASGHEGVGRMAEPAAVLEAVLGALGAATGAGPAVVASSASEPWLAGRRVVVTAGGTREPIDPVRYLGNRSSGRMGAALVVEAADLGADVVLVSTLPSPATFPGGAPPGVEVRAVETGEEMLAAVLDAVPGASLLVMAAAVADYRPATVATGKLKKTGDPLRIDLVPTVDILGALRDDPARDGCVVVGFAAETDDLVANARRKLTGKGLDLIVANDVSADGVGIGADDNAVVILGRDGRVVTVPRAPKPEIARRIFAEIRPLLNRRPSTN